MVATGRVNDGGERVDAGPSRDRNPATWSVTQVGEASACHREGVPVGLPRPWVERNVVKSMFSCDRCLG